MKYLILTLSLFIIGCSNQNNIVTSLESDLKYEDIEHPKIEVKDFINGAKYYVFIKDTNYFKKSKKDQLEIILDLQAQAHDICMDKSFQLNVSSAFLSPCIVSRINNDSKNNDIYLYWLKNNDFIELITVSATEMLGSKLSSKELEELIELSINEVERLKSQEIKRVNALNVFTSKFGQRCRDYGYRFKEDIDSCVTKEAVTEQRLVEYEAKIAQLERTIRENKIPTKEEKSDWDKFLQALVETGEELEKEEMKRDIESLKNQQRIERNRQNTKRAMDMLYRRPPTRY